MERNAQTERQRERTTLQYHDIYSIPHVLDLPPAARPATPAEQLAAPSPDSTFTAFAQLVALRLNVQRCLISLFDAERQYVIAEATRSLALRSDSEYKHDEGDELWLSGCAISRSCGFCEHVLVPPDQEPIVYPSSSEESTPAAGLGTVTQADLSIIPDLAKDERFDTRPYILTYPHNRFYAGSPIRTSLGVDIGVLCVFDTEPRPQGLGKAQQEFLIDVASSIMGHLESHKLRNNSRRNERMVRGIGSFVEGSSTLAGWWSEADTSSYGIHAQAQGEGTLDPTQQNIAKQATINPTSGRETSPQTVPSEHHQKPARSGSRGSRRSGSNVSRQDYAESGGVTDQSSPPAHMVQPVRSPLETHRLAVQTTFAKAANILRESLEIEGVVFLDARISTFGGLVPLRRGESTSSVSDTPDELSGYFSATTTTHSGSEDKSTSPSSPPEEHKCKVLASATSDSSTINETAKDRQYNMSESSLKALIRHYPTGTVFNFDKLGIPQSSDSEGLNDIIPMQRPNSATQTSPKTSGPAPPLKKRRRTKLNDGGAVLKLAPGARAAAFFPLWDYDRQRWFSGALVWSSRARPFSTRGELSYLAAFGNTIMSQIARLDALVIDKAKTDLLGSISHELRSPLHGVLGGAEMLADTDINPFQNDVLHTIETCVRTLLDTMDHLLDFANINSFSHEAAVSKRQGKSRSRKGKHGRRAVQSSNYTAESGMRGLFNNVELDILVEEVVESVCAGQQFFSRTIVDPPLTPMDEAVSKQLGDRSTVAIILDLDYTTSRTTDTDTTAASPKNWMFNVVPGGIRRILMNIFSNALKYTDHGSIRVSLSSSPTPDHGSDVKSTGTEIAHTETTEQVVLRVTDTGRGISSGFLENQMFLPFTQEDRLNPGTGLGLSIAQQIVSNLNGQILVRSDVGIGTELTIKLPLAHSQNSARASDSPEAPASTSGRELREHIKAARGLRIALVGFSGPDTRLARRISGEVPGVLSRRASYEPETEEWKLPRAEIENICRAKLAMEVLPAPRDNAQLFEMDPRPELLLTTEGHLDQLVEDLARMRSKDRATPPIVVVCPSIAAARARTHRHERSLGGVDFISQPCGPMKLADAFALSMTRWAEEKGNGDLTPMSAVPHDEHAEVAETRDEFVLRPASQHDGVSTVRFEGSAPGQEVVHKRDRFLLVEDNPINMRILTAFMRKQKSPYDAAENGLLALESYKRRHGEYSYVLMDISMPVMTGLEASREIRAFEKDHNLPAVTIIALTALASEGIRQEAFASGIDLFLTKPVKLKELGDIIRQTGRKSSEDSGAGR